MAKVITVDFTGVQSGGGRPRIPEGDYGFEIKAVTQKTSKEKQPYLEIGFQPIQGNPKGVKKIQIIHRCSLQKQSLWNLRNLMEACGKDIPSKAVKIDLDKMTGWKCGGTVIDEEYNDRKYSQISAFFPLEDLQPYEAEQASAESEEEEGEEGEEEEIFS